MKRIQHSLVLIKVDPVVEKAKEGFFIQEEWQSLPPTGVVLQVGKEVTFCKKGDHVLFARYSAIEVPGEPDQRLCKEEAVLAIL